MSVSPPERLRSSLLIVDDNPANLSLLLQILDGYGYKVRVAPSGKLALASVLSAPPDLILLDVNMPGMDGYEVCRQLKAREQTYDIPVIFISALNEATDKLYAFTVGGVDYITKPFEPVELLARVANHLQLREFQLQLQEQNAQLQLLLTTTQAISAASDVDGALQEILANVCQTTGWDLGEVWIANAGSTALQRAAFWCREPLISQMQVEKSLPPDLVPLEAPLSETTLPGRLWLLQRIEWIENLALLQTAPHQQLVERFGLKTALGIPIVFDRQVLAALVLFRQQSGDLDGRSLELVESVAAQLGALLQRQADVAALRLANLELKRLANLDGLTQLANRRRFDEYLLQEWRRMVREQRPLSLIMCDVDYFKPYNDYYGHQVGDDCLQRVAQAMSQVAKRPADLVARYGGEEFAVILPNTHLEGALAVAQEMGEAVRHLRLAHAASTISPYVTLSLGVASTIPEQHLLPERLIVTADQALYAAKAQGRDRTVGYFMERFT